MPRDEAVSDFETAAERLRTAAAEDLRPPAFSDDALALRFTAEHGQDLRYTATWAKWHRWDRTRWREDDTLSVFALARNICRAAARECNDAKPSNLIASAKTVAAVERLARADRQHAATVDQWDADPMLLNTPGGVIDLRTGDLMPHRRDDHMSKITTVAPGGDCPLWLTFLNTITAGDCELQAYLRRVAGYCLTGLTSAHALFFAYGTGANGKTVFVNALSGILGGYAKTAPPETFMASTTDRHPTELAMLRGARLVTAIETEEGRRWSEARIKALTGGDRIAARFMHANFFEFVPQFKLLTAGNHKPALRNVDEAMRRRLHLIPFTVTIPAEERDEKLGEKLREEWPGILAWAVQGCLESQGEGLQPPAAVRAATADYLAEEDAISIWIEEACSTKPNDWSSSADLYRSWTTWAEAAGEFVGTKKRLSQALKDRDFVARPGGHQRTRGFEGIRPMPPPSPEGQSDA